MEINLGEEQLPASNQQLQTILDHVGAYIFTKDLQYRYTYANKLACDMFGCSLEEIVGSTDEKFFDLRASTQLRIHDCSVVEQGERIESEESNVIAKTGEIRHYWTIKLPMRDVDGSIVGICGISSDITEWKKLEDQVHHLAFYDSLTNLPNRRLLNDRLAQVMAASKRSGCYGAVMFLDLDEFKLLNDSQGHGVGDLLLIEAANRLKSCLRGIDTVARFGGDEFVVIIGDLDAGKSESITQAEIVAGKIRASLAMPYVLNYRDEGIPEKTVEHHCTASIGVAMFNKHEASRADILKWADMAMYKAKEAGGNSVRFS